MRIINMHARFCFSSARRVLSCGALLGAAACTGLLDVSDPTLIQGKDIANPAGAAAQRAYVLSGFSSDMAYIAHNVALFSDERMYDNYSLPNNPPWGDRDLNLDRRDSVAITTYATSYGDDRHIAYLDDAYTRTSISIPTMRAYGADSVKHEYLAQLFGIRGYLALQMAEDLCGGFPINEVSNDHEAVLSGPYSTDSATTYAVTQLDSALANGHDSTNFLNFARVVKGRALLDLGQYAQAAAAVASVPTAFVLTTDVSVQGNGFTNHGPVWYGGSFPYPVGEKDGGNGLPFVSAQDPRVVTFFKRVRYMISTDSLYDQSKYPVPTTPMVLASGLEARLIEAEAALHAGDPSWFATLNTLRATMITPAMAPIPTMPSTTAAQVDLLYRERAFWLFLTGRRLGDMRRLVRRYGRGAETVFPTGHYPMGGSYGTAISIPFSKEVQGRFNPRITTGCTTP